MKPIIKAENIDKLYRIGSRESYYTLRDKLAEALSSPFRAFRNNRDASSETIWALRNVSFEVAPGEVMGIIGRNGAGKSTLLKILSRITEPTSGKVELFGRVGSLLEVGTGFHPELTGGENILLNGALLGMRRREIMEKFDEIVAFSEIGKFINTPVKRYSSGMYMRLAFAVAAHLEPEILLVDEVLAVGDAAFQQKCLGKMNEVSQEGRTVLFVSHNVAAVSQLCSRTMLLADGQVKCIGPTSEVVTEYFQVSSAQREGEHTWNDPQSAPGNDKVRLRSVRVVSEGFTRNEVDIDKDVQIEVDFWNLKAGARKLCVNLYLYDARGAVVLSTANTSAANQSDDRWYRQEHERGLFRAVCTIPGNFLNDGVYFMSVYVLTLAPTVVEAQAQQILYFNVLDTGVMREPGVTAKWDGVVRLRLPWQTSLVSQDEVGDADEREPQEVAVES
jgi:lipopolysaccharide transport system ATP-binding protein